jgi:hypothetical protein
MDLFLSPRRIRMDRGQPMRSINRESFITTTGLRSIGSAVGSNINTLSQALGWKSKIALNKGVFEVDKVAAVLL